MSASGSFLIGNGISIEEFLFEVEIPYLRTRNEKDNDDFELDAQEKIYVDKNVEYDGVPAPSALLVSICTTLTGKYDNDLLPLLKSRLTKAAEELYKSKPEVAEKLAEFEEDGSIKTLYFRCLALNNNVHGVRNGIFTPKYIPAAIPQTGGMMMAFEHKVIPGQAKKP